MIDASVPAVVEAYSLSAGPQRALNLVEATPEDATALENDIHGANVVTTAARDPVKGPNLGWTTLGGDGPLTNIELCEQGPLRGRVRLSRAGETWEFTWYAGSPAVRWRAARGFRFAAVSADPYLPFDRCVDGSEYFWPTGPGEDEPPDHDIAPRPWTKLPGGHCVYYRKGENYGALGIVALDPELNWSGAGSRRFEAANAGGPTELGLTFPEWRAGETVLEARRENRVLRQPVLVLVEPTEADPPPIRQPAEREPRPRVEPLSQKPAAYVPERLPLSGEWELAWCEKGQGPPGGGWRTVRVPGSAHTQWLEPSQIYTRQAEWVSNKEWWYRKQFALPAGMGGRRLRLQFEAVDYYSDIYVNGRRLGHHEGYMDPFELDATEALHPGDNEILVRTWTPVDYYWKHRPYTVKGSYGAVDQKPDDITALGITRAVWLRASDPAWIAEAAVSTRLTEEGAEVAIDTEIGGEPAGDLVWDAWLFPRNFEGPGVDRWTTPALGVSGRLVIPVKEPRLWWTWDHGRPNLYTLELRLREPSGRVLDGRTIPVGIREIEKDGWTFYLNRRRLFIRGSNYYYHLFMSEMKRADYERDLELMLGMNINLIRLHCHFSNPEFYDLADEHGVLVWQDLLEAWYPHDREFALRAAALYDPLIRAVRNHPSVALWATCDEEDLENYRVLTKHLAPRPALLDPQRRPVVRSTGRYGDAHVYHGWYDGSIWDYTNMTEAFVSELGATALPNYETLAGFMAGQWPITEHAEEWMFRRLQIPEALRAWGDPAGLTMREYVPQTQDYVARLFQIALERMRRLKYHPAGGILHFHAIDIWPSVTMAAIDFQRRPTRIYDTVRRSFEPVLASLEYDRDRWPEGASFHCGVWAINDRWEPVPEAVIRWRILGGDASGPPQAEGQWPVSMAADSARKIGDVTWTAHGPGPHELHAEVRGGDGGLISENIFRFRVDNPPEHR